MLHFIMPFVAIVMLGATSPSSSNGITPALYSDMRWRLIGPFLGGRTVAVAGIPTLPNVAYVGAVDGGVWRTENYGLTWQPVFDGQDTQSIGAIAVAPTNASIIYVGSGEGLRRPDLSTGDGVYKSTDGAHTWTHLGLRDSQQIAKIIVDPHDANRLFVAALGHPYGPNPERGVYRSLDGGKTFTRVLYKDENTGAIDLAFDPTNAQTVYAALWVSRRSPWHMGGEMEAPGSGLYVSHDGGDSWKQLTTGLPGVAQGLGRIGIAIAPDMPSRMYAWVQADAKHTGIYRSDDAGASWHVVNSDPRVSGRGDDFACVTVDPTNPSRIFVANTSTWLSSDAGATFTALKGAPGGDDYHTIWINPLHPSVIVLAVDQGATISVDGGGTWTPWYNQPTAQFFHVTTDNRFPYWVYGAEQESGSTAIASRSDSGEITFRDYHPVNLEEYGYAVVDPLDPNIVYGGKAQRDDQRTSQVQDISPDEIGQYRYDRTAPMAISQVDKHALFLAANVVFETTNAGHSWKIISPDLTRQHESIPPTVGVFAPKKPGGGVIFSLALSKRDASVLWAGTDDGLIWRTSDGGAHWKNVTPHQMGQWEEVRTLETSRTDDRTAYAAVARYRLDDAKPYIYRTHDGGASWSLITRGLPDDAWANVVREDPVRPGLLYAGTERGVYVSFDDGGQWLPLSLNLPSTSMRDLTIHGDDLVVATHGRSFWILDDLTPLREMAASIASSSAYLFKPQVTYRFRHDRYQQTPFPPEVPAGQNPPDGAIIDYYLGAAATGIVRLDILDPHGGVVRTYKNTDTPPLFMDQMTVPNYWIRMPAVPPASAGMHRFVWDLRYDRPWAINHSYSFSAVPHDTQAEPLGATVPPGRYTVRLTVDGRSTSQPLTIVADPRLSTNAAGYADQLALEQQISALMERSYAAWKAAKAAASPRADDLEAINDTLSGLMVAVDDGDCEPTEQQVAAVATVRAQLSKLMKM